MRDDVLAAIAWLERFVPDFPRPRMNTAKITAFDIEEAWIFKPRHGGRANERPFEFVRDHFIERRAIKDESERTGKYDIREKAIKLSLNSIYGKLAQSVGGAEGKAAVRRKSLLRRSYDGLLPSPAFGGRASRSACYRLFRDGWHCIDTAIDWACAR